MALAVKIVEYYNVTVEGGAGAAAELLTLFAGAGVSLLAFKAVPLDHAHTRFSLFPDDGSKMIAGAGGAGLALDGPHAAVLVQGDEQPGALGGIYEKLARAGIAVGESSGIAHINDGYGVVLYLGQEDCIQAAAALER